MSYSLALRAHGGKIVNTRISGELPDGQIDITGHEDKFGRSVTVTRYDTSGKHAASASHYQPGVDGYATTLLPVPEPVSERLPDDE